MATPIVRDKAIAHTAQYGFTLIEILVVLVILTIIVTAAAISVGQKLTQYHAKTIASQLKTVIPLVAQEALLQSATYGLMVTEHQYQIFQFTHNNWQPLSQPLFRKSNPTADINLALELNGNLVKMPPNVSPPAPQILFSNSGDVTPFILLITTRHGTVIYKIQGDANGIITATPIQKKK